MRDPTAYFDHIRAELATPGGLTDSNVAGFNTLYKTAELRRMELNHCAYAHATVWWETGKTMAHVEEAYYLGNDAEAYRQGLKYAPYWGRGWSQLTWDYNYEKAGEMLGLDLLNNPDLALVPTNSCRILFWGLETGAFTGKSLGDYIDDVDEADSEDFKEYKNARKVVNGTDKDDEIANLALVFEAALKAGGYLDMPPVEVPEGPGLEARVSALEADNAKQWESIADLETRIVAIETAPPPEPRSRRRR